MDSTKAAEILVARFAGTEYAVDHASAWGWINAGWTADELAAESEDNLCDLWAEQCRQAQIRV